MTRPENPAGLPPIDKKGRIGGWIVENIPEDYLDERLEEIFEEFLVFKEKLDNPAGRPKVIKNKLKKFVKNINLLQNTLNELGSLESTWLGKCEIIEDELDNPLKWLTTDNNKEELKSLEEYLCNIKSRAERALDFFGDSKGGPPENIALKYFINRMAWLWEKKYGKKPSKTFPIDKESKNEFLDYVHKCLKELGHPPHSRDSLARHIQRTLP